MEYAHTYIFRAHERFCVVFACPHNNLENQISNDLLSSRMILILENLVRHRVQIPHFSSIYPAMQSFEKSPFSEISAFQDDSESLHFQWKRLHSLLVYMFTKGKNIRMYAFS